MKAVVLAGGLGGRLKPFTQVIPIGESSVLEIQMLTLRKCGFDDVIIATNYMSDYVQAFMGDGKRYNMRITFSREEKPLGTCGPLSLVKDKLTEPFVLMNGDILTTLDFAKAYNTAMGIDSDLVVMTKEIITPFQFGRIIAQDNFITGVEEKPDLKLEILAGIYIMKPAVFDLIPHNEYFGIDSLIKTMLGAGRKVGRYPMSEYWLDIGRIDDYQVAQDAYQTHFAELKQ